LGEYGTLQFHDLFENFNYLEINECENYDEELEEQIERKEIDRELYDSFNNELGIDVELLAYVAQSAKLGKQGEDEDTAWAFLVLAFLGFWAYRKFAR